MTVEKFSFESYSIRDFISNHLGLNWEDFIEVVAEKVTWGDDGVKYTLLDPMMVVIWISDFCIVQELDWKYIVKQAESFTKENNVRFFFL